MFCNTFEKYFRGFNSSILAYDNWHAHLSSFGIGDYLNNDFINDHFQVYCEGINPLNFVFEIRKGCKQVFYSTNPDTQWDGTFRGEIKPGIYKYKIEVLTIHDEMVTCKGEVCVIEYPNPKKGFKDCEQCVFGDMLNISTGEIQHPTFDL